MSTDTASMDGLGDSPNDEMSELASDFLPLFWTAAAAVGLEGQRRLQNDCHDRVAADYRFQNEFMRQVNGMQPDAGANASSEDNTMGDMILVGRINNNVPGQDIAEQLKMLKGKVMDQNNKPAATPPTAEPQATPTPQSAPASPISSIPAAVASSIPMWAKAAMIAGGLGTTGLGGALVGTLITAAKQPVPAVVQASDTDTDTSAAIGIKRD